jgi:hypothetical protein
MKPVHYIQIIVLVDELSAFDIMPIRKQNPERHYLLSEATILAFFPSALTNVVFQAVSSANSCTWHLT